MKKIFFYFILLFFTNDLNAQNWDINLLDRINTEENKRKDLFYNTLSSTIIPISIVIPITMIEVGNYYNNPTAIENGYYLTK